MKGSAVKKGGRRAVWKDGGSAGRKRGRRGERDRNRLGSARSQVSRAWNRWAREDSTDRDVGLVLVQVSGEGLAGEGRGRSRVRRWCGDGILDWEASVTSV